MGVKWFGAWEMDRLSSFVHLMTLMLLWALDKDIGEMGHRQHTGQILPFVVEPCCRLSVCEPCCRLSPWSMVR